MDENNELLEKKRKTLQRLNQTTVGKHRSIRHSRVSL